MFNARTLIPLALTLTVGCGARALTDELDFPTPQVGPGTPYNEPADVTLPAPAPISCEDLGWVKFEARDRSGDRLYFDFCGPKALRNQVVQGIDSYVGAFISDTLSIEYDLGLWSDPLTTYSDSAQFSVNATTIDGRVARMVSYVADTKTRSGHQHIASVYFPLVYEIHPEIKLTLHVEAATAADQEIAFAIFKTLRFFDSPY